MISQKIVNALGLNFQGKFTLGWLRNDQIFDLERPQEGEFLVIDLCSWILVPIHESFETD